MLRFRKTNDWSEDRGRCPRCASVQRHRHLWLYLERHTDLLSTPAHRVLHFAPEQGVSRRLSEVGYEQYLTADLESGRADVAVDLQQLPFDDGTFDVVLCVHVLEHVPDDARALSEICRVLAPGGWAILQVPMHGETTREDPDVTSAQERVKHYGRPDHVRMYGRDFADRVAAAGFDVRTVVFRDELSPRERRRYGLDYNLPWDYNTIPEPWEITIAARR
jgi:SAM-dependent methyltransferase